jgi:hypothetical protein
MVRTALFLFSQFIFLVLCLIPSALSSLVVRIDLDISIGIHQLAVKVILKKNVSIAKSSDSLLGFDNVQFEIR